MELYYLISAINPRAVWPGFLTVILAAPAFVTLGYPRSWAGSRTVDLIARYGVVILFTVAAGQFVLALLYLRYPSYYNHMEANAVVQSWLGWRGLPLYPSPTTGDIYAFPYGPALFETLGAALWAFGPSIAASKIPGLAAFVATPILSFVMLRRSGAKIVEAMAITAAQCFVQAGFDNEAYAYGARADVFLMLTAQGAMFAATCRPTIANAIILGLLAGLESNLKIHGVLYVLPAAVYFLLTSQRLAARLENASIGFAAALVTFSLPFLPHNVSFAEYLHYFELLSHHPLDRWLFEQNVAFAAMLILPIIPLSFRALRTIQRGTGWFQASIIGCMAIVCIIASAEGAGPHHLLPFLPSIAWGFFVEDKRLVVSAQALTVATRKAVLMIALVIGYSPIVLISWQLVRLNTANVDNVRIGLAEIENALRDKPFLKIAVGPGESVAAQELRVIPVFHGNPLPIDSSAWMEFDADGVSEERIISVLETCQVDLWLMPKGPPFSMGGQFSGPHKTQLFSPAIREGFRASYVKIRSGQVFDTWGCKQPR